MRLIVVAVLVTSSAFAEDATLKFRDAAALGGGGSVTAYVRDAHDVVIGAGAQVAVPAESLFIADDRFWGMILVRGRFDSLADLVAETLECWESKPETLEEVTRQWRSWLEIREHEGFSREAQAARDLAWED